MRILHDPRSIARNAGPGDTVFSLIFKNFRKREAAAKTGAKAAARTAPTTGRGSTFISGRGLSATSFLMQLKGKLGQRPLLAGR